MNKNTAMTMGIAAATLAGTAAYVLTHHRTPYSRRLKRNATKAIKTLGNVLDGVESMIR